MNTDIIRRLENMIRIGQIKTITPAKPFTTVTVSIGEILTTELRCLNFRSGKDQTWDLPSIGEEVVVLSPSGDLALGVVISGLNNELFPSPSDDVNQKLRLYEDGCLISYDVKSHVLEAILPEGGTAVLTVPGGVTINGNLQVNGEVKSTGNISTDADVIAGEISLKSHKTMGVKSGSEKSGGPTP